MNRCKHCKKEITGETDRFDKGTRLSTGEIIRDDVKLHPPCTGPWVLAHFPWLAPSYTRDRTRVD